MVYLFHTEYQKGFQMEEMKIIVDLLHYLLQEHDKFLK